MKQIKQLSLLGLLLFTTPLLWAQSPTSSSSKFGLGFSTDILTNTDISTGNRIYLTWDPSQRIRIEPSFRLFLNENIQYYGLGLGVLGKNPHNEFNLIYGLRYSYLNLTESYVNYENMVEFHLLAPMIGGEYFLNERFSIGAEVQFSFFLNKDTAPINYTSTQLNFRFYF